MKRIQTELKGVTTGSVYEDGEMYSLVNLRRKGGALHPVAPHAVEQELCGAYDVYFIHKNEDWSHWIGVVNDAEGGTSDVYWDINAADCAEVKVLKADTGGVINSVEQNGNLLIFITDDTVYYALFKEGDYRWYGELPDLVPVEWNCYEEKEYYADDDGGNPDKKGKSLNIDTLNMISENRYAEHQTAGKYGYIYNKTISRDDLSGLETTLKAHVNEMRVELGEYYNSLSSLDPKTLFRGLFFDAFLVRYAYRLYDDTNVRLSPPVLIMPASSLLQSITVTSGWGFIVDIGQVDYGFWARLGKMFMKGYVPGVKYDLSSLSGYEGIIKGVDIFMSPLLNITGTDRIADLNRLFPFIFPGYIDVNVPTGETRTIALPEEADLDVIRDMSSFYLVKSIDLGESTNGDYVPFPEKTDTDTIRNIENLVHRPQLEDDTVSLHKTGAKRSYFYNGRIHLSDTKTSYFGGFDRAFFGWENASTLYRTYNGSPAITYSYLMAAAGDQVIIEVEIDRGSAQGKVYSSRTLTEDSFLIHSAMLSYPDAGAKKMTFYVKKLNGNTERLGTFDLVEHDFLNLAYYINENLLPVYFSAGGPQVPELDLTGGFSFQSPNELRISEVNNPLRVTNENILAVGNGRILALGSNAMNVSEWNFGSYPLYVFTSEGVYVLKVGEGDVAYSVITQAAFLEGPVSDVICRTPQGVVFAVARGLCIINGTRVDFLSKAVEEDPVDLRFQVTPEMEGVLPDYGKESFREFLKGLTGMVYDNYRNELIIMNRSKVYNRVFSFDDGSFYVTLERIEHVVQNSLPELKVVSGRKLLDFAREEGDAHVSFITRPLLYGTQDVKSMERMVLRGVIYGLKKVSGRLPVVVTHYSNDGRNFLASRGLFVREGNHKDLDMGMYGRNKFRYYSFSFGGICEQETVIEFLESLVGKAYDGGKMR